MTWISSADTLAATTDVSMIREAGLESFVVPIIASAAYARLAHRVKRTFAVRQHPTSQNDHSTTDID